MFKCIMNNLDILYFIYYISPGINFYSGPALIWYRIFFIEQTIIRDRT